MLVDGYLMINGSSAMWYGRFRHLFYITLRISIRYDAGMHGEIAVYGMEERKVVVVMKSR